MNPSSRGRWPLLLAGIIAVLAAGVRPAPARAACEFALIRVVPDGIPTDSPALRVIRSALADPRFSTASTTVEFGAGDRGDLVLRVSRVEAWGQPFLRLDRVVGPLSVASQTIPYGEGGESSGDVLLAIRALVPCANRAPDVKVVQDPPGRLPPGQEVTLDACGSKDPDGDGLTYLWEARSQEASTSVAIPDPRRCRVESLRLPGPGRYGFQVTIRDGVVAATRSLDVAVGAAAVLRWRVQEGGAVGQDIRVQAFVWDGTKQAAASPLRCEVLAAPGAVPVVEVGAGACSFPATRPGTYRVRLSSAAPDGVEVSSLAEVWVGPRTPVPIRGDRSLSALLAGVGSLDLDASVLVRSGEGLDAAAAPGVRLGVRFLLMGQAGISWYAGATGLSAQSSWVGLDVLGWTRLLDPYRRFGAAPRQFGLAVGYESWALQDEAESSRRAARGVYIDFRFEVLRGMHFATRVDLAGTDRMLGLQLGLSVDELLGLIGSRPRAAPAR